MSYEEYSTLPYYEAINRLKGVSKASLTDNDLKTFYDNCIAYEKEYNDAVNKVVYPTMEEMREKCDELTKDLENQYQEACQVIKDHIIDLLENPKTGTYTLATLQDRLNALNYNAMHRWNKDIYPPQFYKTAVSLEFVKKKPEQSRYLKEIKEILKC